jgi:bifunctional non-homologous end joining protein LigD
MSLKDYRRKRDFSRTREPKPGRRGARRKRAIFVVQLHHARARHYDFRLELGGVLKSWAVPKGPSFDPSVKRLAVEVEDHPLEYAAFQGDIPEGAYGAGHVAIFDRGTWSSEEDPAEQLAEGRLTFTLRGRKLKGGWHLVRSRLQGRKPQWLLIKANDEYAGRVEADDLLEPAKAKRARTARAESRRPARLVAKKRAARRVENWASKAACLTGARARSLRAAFYAPQLARLVDEPPDGEDWLHEAKWDGYRLLAVVKDGAAHLWSRNALEWTRKVPEIARALESLPVDAAAFDGELIAGSGGRDDFGALQAGLSGDRRVR